MFVCFVRNTHFLHRGLVAMKFKMSLFSQAHKHYQCSHSLGDWTEPKGNKELEIRYPKIQLWMWLDKDSPCDSQTSASAIFFPVLSFLWDEMKHAMKILCPFPEGLHNALRILITEECHLLWIQSNSNRLTSHLNMQNQQLSWTHPTTQYTVKVKSGP